MEFNTQADLLNYAWNHGYLFCDLGITWNYRYDGVHYVFYEKELINDKG